MATTVTYKGNTIATVTNNTETLATAGRWLEQDIVITDANSESGGGSSATQHIISFELSDETTSNISVYYNDSVVENLIKSSKPTTYNNKTIETAYLDGTQWYAHET